MADIAFSVALFVLFEVNILVHSGLIEGIMGALVGWVCARLFLKTLFGPPEEDCL